MVQIVSEDQLRAVIGYDRAAFDRIEQAYVWMRTRKVSMPPVFHIEIDPQSAVDVKGAYVEGLGVFAIKMASGFYDNPGKGLASSSSVILLISSSTGFCEAVFLDNGYLMNVRTALAGAVAAHHLARRDARKVGVIGTGVQAREQIKALQLVRDVDQIMVWGRDAEKASACVHDIAGWSTGKVGLAPSAATLAAESDIIITTTASQTPLFGADCIRPGTHITAMGSDLPGKQELPAGVLKRADILACDSIAQCRIGGELQHVDEGALRNQAVALASVIAGEVTRQSDTDITICDMTGLGVLDTAISDAAFARLNKA